MVVIVPMGWNHSGRFFFAGLLQSTQTCPASWVGVGPFWSKNLWPHNTLVLFEGPAIPNESLSFEIIGPLGSNLPCFAYTRGDGHFSMYIPIIRIPCEGLDDHPQFAGSLLEKRFPRQLLPWGMYITLKSRGVRWKLWKNKIIILINIMCVL